MLSLLWMFVLHLAAVTGSNNAMAAVVSSLFLLVTDVACVRVA